jgi:signal transduction histidine kinase
VGGVAAGRGANLLVVDDDADTRRLFRLMLEAEGYACDEAAGGAAALAAVAAGGVDLVLLDVRLGGEDGLELARELLAGGDVGVVMVSGIDDPKITDAATELGSYGYLVKPVRRDELLLHVANACRRLDLERQTRDLVRDLERRVDERTSELRAALDRAEAADAVRTQFLQNVSHELRTPLTVILAGAALLPRTTDPEQLAGIGASIEQQGRRLLDLIERLLEVAALDEAPLARSAAEPVDLRGLLALVADPARAAGRPVTVAVELDGHATVVGSPPRLVAAFSHLVDNALRFTDPGSPLELVATPGADGTHEVAVIDHGPGVTGAIRERLWEPFVQGDGTAVRERGGLGVGLYLCRRLVEWHGGHVEARDTPGGGLTVVVSLPHAGDTAG